MPISAYKRSFSLLREALGMVPPFPPYLAIVLQYHLTDKPEDRRYPAYK